jgi:hypothetical protein
MITKTKYRHFLAILCAFGLSAPSFGQAFPPIQPGQTSYTVTADEASGLVINTLALPENFTLKVDPSVKSINWIVSKIVIGSNATIDLSAPQDKPPRARDGGGMRQAQHCVAGLGGIPGGNGMPGAPGVSLTINNVESIDNHGSLWIHTDGGPGGDGGNGGPGQLGGGHKSFGEGLFHGGSCGSAPGGPGGPGGAGGPGGPTARVLITFKASGTAPITNHADAPTCGPTQRPAIAQGNTGVIVISGAPGCGGQPGNPGAHGGHG